jgi:DNA-binding HxlR family transcriptional regulator
MADPTSPGWHCPIEAALEVIGGKWKSVIIWHLRDDTLRFSELRRLMPAATRKMLTQQLRQLEHDDIVNRVVYPEVPPRVEYSLTAYGRTLRPVMDAMKHWGVDHVRLRHVDS